MMLADARLSENTDMLVRMVTWVVLTILLTSVDMAFQTRVPIESLGETGEGSGLRQAVYLLAMVATVTTLVWRQSIAGLSDLFPNFLVLLFIWAAVTLIWSPVPGIGARRLILTIITSITVLSLAALQSADALFRAYRQVVMSMAIVGLFVVLFLPELGIHQPGDSEPLIVGAWRGVFYHKNIFGSILAPAFLISAYYLIIERERRFSNSMCCGFLLFMLVMSGSKTSLSLALLLAFHLTMSEYIGRNKGGRFFLSAAFYASLIVAILLLIYAIAEADNLDAVEPTAFTGRGYIWRALLLMADGKTVFGIGFQSVFQTGTQSPLSAAFSERFFVTLPHAHNAYLEMIISIGWVGLAIFILAIVFEPLLEWHRLSLQQRRMGRLCLSLLLLTWLHGFLESGLFDRDRSMWIVFLLAYGALRNRSDQRGVFDGS